MNSNLIDIYQRHLEEYLSDKLLRNHREFIKNNNLGFGEDAFHVVWRDLVSQMPSDFKFLEIGVYKGQVLSLVKLLAEHFNKNIEFYGVTLLSKDGDKFSSYEDVDYKFIIDNLFKTFNLEFDIDKNIINGSSNDEKIKKIIKNKKYFDLVYIDGCHDYEYVVSDIMLMKEITKSDAIIVFDDASCYKSLPSNLFKGHVDVCDAIRDVLETDSDFEEILCVGHNRVFKRV